MSDEISLVRTERIAPVRLRELVGRHFGEMVKYVADVQRGIIAVGGELHADAEALLIADGSRQEDLWGANLYPDRPSSERIEFTSLINIRPRAGNRGMELQDPTLRQRVSALTERLLLGRDDELP
jgi:hypothetical protein